jgi:hypothetical protein
MPRVPRPKPVKVAVPGQKKGPTRNQARPSPKRPWSKGEDAAKAVGNRVADAIGKLNPFD